MNNPHVIQITLSAPGEKFARDYSSMVKTTRQPAGLNFYEISWTAKRAGRMSVESGASNLSIANVLHVSASEDADFLSEGIVQLNLISQLSPDELIAHDEARLRVHAVLDGIRLAGWRTLVPRGAPRLRGKEMMKYALAKDEFTTLDSAYHPTLQERMALRDGVTWAFVSNNTFLEVSFNRNRAYKNPLQSGVYLLNFVLKTEREHFRSEVRGEDRKRWREVLPGEHAKLRPIRAAEEVLLKSQGVVIDETYVDPKLPQN